MHARLPPLKASRSVRLPQIRIDHFTAIILGAAVFNAGLAFLNAHGMRISSSIVIVCEALLYAYAVAIGCRHITKAKEAWLLAGAALLGLNLMLGVMSGVIDPKFARDVLVIPIFVVLGLSATRKDVIRVVIRLQWVVLLVMLYEAILPESYGNLFNIVRYYIDTRGFSEEQFWNEGSTLFASATRPGERFLMGFLDIHRLSSVFLEPVSLGNYCVIVSMIIVAVWSYLNTRQRIFLAVSTFMILVGCDGRFATVTILLVIALRWLSLMMPRYVNALYLPGVLVAVISAILILGWRYDGDTFQGRLVFSYEAIMNFRFVDLMGLAPNLAYNVMDSGLAYLLYSQSIFGVLLIWCMIAFGIKYQNKSSVIYLHGVCAYIALNLLVSNSLFSVKTAGLLWFTYGALARDVALPAGARLAARAARPVHRLGFANRSFSSPPRVHG
ncbi:hypothetical protein [Chthonobacter rhizosphaerae]|uniref:hypothetical protein n=1 Tax=Chthonobacter rhizosphaerae TaxID=2735553 RepID=UPI0015EE3E6E|nr:hypothetical protein [Chthonobacter rhizosphaerae]